MFCPVGKHIPPFKVSLNAGEEAKRAAFDDVQKWPSISSCSIPFLTWLGCCLNHWTHFLLLPYLFSFWMMSPANCRTLSIDERSSFFTANFLLPVVCWMSWRAELPLEMLRQARITLAPREAESRAVSRPMPVKLEAYLTCCQNSWYGNDLIGTCH